MTGRLVLTVTARRVFGYVAAAIGGVLVGVSRTHFNSQSEV
jgi:hypothetical protein